MGTAKEKGIIITSVLVLLVGITIIGLVLRNTKNTDTRVVASCPDYWYNSKYKPCSLSNFGCCEGTSVAKVDASGSNCTFDCNEITDTNFGCCDDGFTGMTDASGSNCPVQKAMCYNVNNLGDYTNASCQQMDFNTATYTGSDALCQKQTYSKTCQISWDGISNVPSACGT